MGKQIKLSNIDFAKVGNTLAEASKVGGVSIFVTIHQNFSQVHSLS